jgi:hypothetical protein
VTLMDTAQVDVYRAMTKSGSDVGAIFIPRPTVEIGDGTEHVHMHAADGTTCVCVYVCVSVCVCVCVCVAWTADRQPGKGRERGQ